MLRPKVRKKRKLLICLDGKIENIMKKHYLKKRENKKNDILLIDGIEIYDERKYGNVILIFIRKE